MSKINKLYISNYITASPPHHVVAW
jgi:hypothetical protein